MTTLLKGGSPTEDVRLDRVYQLDLRSLNYSLEKTAPSLLEARPRSFTWDVGVYLDQGQEGACVGFGYSHDLASRPVRVAGVSQAFARQGIYWVAQKEDDWDGGSYPGANPVYEGTSVLAGAKVCKELGFYKEYHWALTAKEVVLAVGHRGPCILGLTMRDGMMDPDENGFLTVTGGIVGGHCILTNAVKIVFSGIKGKILRNWDSVDLDKSYITVWNSWGRSWGNNGTAKISIRTLMTLVEGDHGEACLPVRNPLKTAV